jgi:ubiquinone/menaquinone biosynthesis C-methylase UbiE
LFNLEFLHVIREYEFARIAPHLQPGARVLEIGGGTGYQARRLQEAGFDVASIDLAHGTYASSELEFPVLPYDGRHFPFPDASFDIVFSSNVLEHIPDLAQTHRETVRVLRPGGYCVHVLPTGSWRFWTNIAHYIEFLQRAALHTPQLLPRRISGREARRLAQSAKDFLALMKHYAIVPRHGESGNAVSEIVTFGKRRWLHHFRACGFDVIESVPIGLFYTGHMVLGRRVPIALRRQVAPVLGSACVLYKMKPAAERASQIVVATEQAIANANCLLDPSPHRRATTR